MCRFCNVKIETTSGGGKAYFESAAKISEGERGWTVSYLQDGDETQLFFSDEGCSMTRKGDLLLTMNFLEGEETKCVLSSGESRTEIPVGNTRFRLRKEREGFRLLLAYELCYEFGAQRFLLKIDIRNISEEK